MYANYKQNIRFPKIRNLNYSTRNIYNPQMLHKPSFKSTFISFPRVHLNVTSFHRNFKSFSIRPRYTTNISCPAFYTYVKGRGVYFRGRVRSNPHGKSTRERKQGRDHSFSLYKLFRIPRPLVWTTISSADFPALYSRCAYENAFCT